MKSNRYRDLLAAAERLLDARECEMLTSEEWDDLAAAVAACTPTPAPRSESFSVDRQGALVRSVVPAKGEPYEHRCTAESFERVAHAVDEAGEQGCTLEEVAAIEGLPCTQVATALAFLKDRGCVTVEGRRSYPAGGGVHLDAMTEFHALRESGGPSLPGDTDRGL